MKARVPLIIFEAEDYKDLVAYSQLMSEGVTLNLNINFASLNLHDYFVPVEQTKIDADVNTMLKIKQEQLENLTRDIEFLSKKIQDKEEE